MSGPSLARQDAHSAIHEAALNEAKELRDLYTHCLRLKDIKKALKVAEVTVEHWESRTLKHAESEEEGLYKDMVKKNPKLKETVIQLTRDHDLMRRMVEEIKQMLFQNEINERIAVLMDGLILVDELHNEDEMNKLLA